MSLSAKVFTILAPVLFLGITAVVFVNYHFQEQIILEQAQRDAEAQAALIKVALVNQMIQKQRVEDSFLHDISNVGDVHNVDVIFRLDSLHLRDQYVDSSRTERLHNRENIILKARYSDAEPVFVSGKASEVVACSLDEHSDRTLASFLGWKPFWLSNCEHLRVVFPFNAEERCQSCHNVKVGKPIGAAYMEVSLAGTTSAIHENAARSILIFVFFVVVGGLVLIIIFQRFVNRPVQKLVHATEVIGSGDLRSELGGEFDNDEFGRLADSIRQMQESLQSAQEELIHQEHLSTVGQMASGIIHDFRTPMSVIAIGIEMLKEDGAIPPQRKLEIYTRVRIALDQMKRMTQELLDFSRGEMKLNLTAQNIPAFIQQIRDLVSDEMIRRKIIFTTNCTYMGEAIIDRDRIYRALVNLLNNAIDAMPDGGSLSFEVHSEGNRLLFRITDTGPGIPMEVQNTLFEPFVTAGKPSGTGLGLAVTKKIVEEHRGTITFRSEPGKGTSFLINLPIS